MPAHSLDLTFAPQDDSVFRGRWQALRAAGLPSLADHRGAFNAPHITVLAASRIPADVLERARAHFSDTLPQPLPLNGVVVLGSGPFVLAEHVIAPPEMHAMVEQWQRLVDGGSHRLRPWTPHVTLAKRLSASQVGRALGVLQGRPAPATVTATELRRWDPEQKTSTREASAPPRPPG